MEDLRFMGSAERSLTQKPSFREQRSCADNHYGWIYMTRLVVSSDFSPDIRLSVCINY